MMAVVEPVPVLPAAAVRVAGWAVFLPDADPDPPGLPAPLRGPVRTACQPVEPRAILGAKGLRYKEPATRLALCATHQALGHPPGARLAISRQPRTALVACGNLGNVETVVTVSRAVRAGSVRDVSPLAAPNTSSNVIASTVALWFGLGGPNIMLCSGAGAGLEGLGIAVRLLRADRADRVVLVGAEPDDEVATALHGGTLRAAAGCAVLERAAGSSGTAALTEPTDGAAGGDLLIGPGGFDPVEAWGDAYGAQGVVSLALAAGVIAAGGAEQVDVACGDRFDGWRAARVFRAAAGGAP